MRVAIYARVSSEKQEKQETIKSQLEALRDYIKKSKYTLSGEYVDDGYSGALLDRPELDRLRDDAKNGLFDSVLIYSPDRLAREYVYAGLVQIELKKNNINIIYLNRPDSKDTPEDNLLEGVQGLISQYEKSKILERTRRGRLHKAKKGFLVTSQAPYGYTYIKMDRNKNIEGHYKVNPKEAKVVKLIFDLFVNKQLSIRAVAKELTKREIPPSRGKQWRASSLHRIIRNETYIGVAHYNKHISVEPKKVGEKYRRKLNTSMKLRPKDQWIEISLPEELKIIDANLFKRAQKQLKVNSDNSPRNVKYKYLLRGLIKCGNCDSPFYGTPFHRELYYRCGNRHRTFPHPKECNMRTIKADNIEGLVWEKFCEAIQNPKLILEQVAIFKDKKEKKIKALSRDIKDLDKEISNIQNEESRLLDAYTEGILSMEQLKSQMDKVKERKDRLEVERQGLIVNQEQGLSIGAKQKSIREYCNAIKKRLDGLKDNFDGKSYLLHLALKKIVFNGKEIRIKGIIPTYNPPKQPALATLCPQQQEVMPTGCSNF